MDLWIDQMGNVLDKPVYFYDFDGSKKHGQIVEIQYTPECVTYYRVKINKEYTKIWLRSDKVFIIKPNPYVIDYFVFLPILPSE